MSQQYLEQKRILVNSLPKSGTHLLTKAIEIFDFQDYAKTVKKSEQKVPVDLNYRRVKSRLNELKEQPLLNTEETINIGSLSPLYVNPSIFKGWLEQISQGEYIAGHVLYSPVLTPLLTELNYYHIFIIRDPRAVIPSLISFILNPQKMPRRHFLETDLKEMTERQRLEFILEGGYAPKAQLEIKGFAEVYRSMLKWCNTPRCLAVRFEDLIGEQGGGNQEKQQKVIENIASYLEIPFDNTLKNKLESIYDRTAPTFRIGKINSWKTALKAEEIKRITEYCEPLCQQAGYKN